MSALKAGHRLTFQQTVDGRTVTRAGRIWSAGPVTGSYWVQADNDLAHPVAVKMPTAAQRGKGALPQVFEVDNTATREVTMQRVDVVSRAREVFGTINPYEPALDGSLPVTYHADPACVADPASPLIPARVHGRDDTLPAYVVTDVLLGRVKRDLGLCRRCILLEVPIQ